MAKAPPTPMESYLAPLAKACLKDPDLEAEVYWAANATWPAPDAAQILEAEEVTFYAEGLLLEGFNMIWQILSDAPDAPATLIRLWLWQSDAPPPPTDGQTVLSQAQWPQL